MRASSTCSVMMKWYKWYKIFGRQGQEKMALFP